MNWSIERRLIVGLGLVLAIATSLGTVSYRTTTGLVRTSEWVEHTHEVLYNLDLLLFQLNKAEAEQRNYLLTEDQSYLEQYLVAVTAANQKIEQLKRLTRDNPIQQQRLDILAPLIKSRIAA